MSSSNMELDKSTHKSKMSKMSKWNQFKKWCYTYHRELAIAMLIILIIIGIWFNPFEAIKNQYTEDILQTGGRIGLSALSSASVARKAGVSNIQSLSNLKNSSEGQSIFDSQKRKALIREGGKGLKGTAGAVSDYAMARFRDNSSLIYEVLYQIAFVIIILLIVFPTAALFIIAIICFIVLRDKLAYVKSL